MEATQSGQNGTTVPPNVLRRLIEGVTVINQHPAMEEKTVQS